MGDKNLTFTHLDVENLSKDLQELMDLPTKFKDFVIKVFNQNGNSAVYGNKEVDHLELKDFITSAAYSDLRSQKISSKLSHNCVALTPEIFGKILIYHKAILLYFPGEKGKKGIMG